MPKQTLLLSIPFHKPCQSWSISMIKCVKSQPKSVINFMKMLQLWQALAGAFEKAEIKVRCVLVLVWTKFSRIDLLLTSTFWKMGDYKERKQKTNRQSQGLVSTKQIITNPHASGCSLSKPGKLPKELRVLSLSALAPWYWAELALLSLFPPPYCLHNSSMFSMGYLTRPPGIVSKKLYT